MGLDPREDVTASAPPPSIGSVYRNADVGALLARAELADADAWLSIAAAFDACGQHRLRAPNALVKHALRVLLHLHEDGRVEDASRLSASFAAWLAADPTNALCGVSRLRWQVVRELAAIAASVPLPVRAALPRGWRLGAPREAKRAVRAYFAGRSHEEFLGVHRILRRHAPTIEAALSGAIPLPESARPQVNGFGVVVLGMLAVFSFGIYLRAAHEPRYASPLELPGRLEGPAAPFRVDLPGASARPAGGGDRMSQVLSADADAVALGRLAADLGEYEIVPPTRALRSALLGGDCAGARAANADLVDATDGRSHQELGAMALPIAMLSSAVRRLCPR